MSSIGKTHGIGAGVSSVQIAARSALTSGRGVFAAWRRNLPAGWWASPVCALFAFGYIAAFKLVFAAFA